MAMATAKRPEAGLPPGESRILLTGIDWAGFQDIVRVLDDRRVPRLTYDEGNLELMSPSYWHDAIARTLGIFVFMLARGLGRPCRDAGTTRWERPDLEKAKEADACFYLEHEPVIRGLKEIDLNIHPPPDLAIEVELTHSLADALKVYAALGVPEVWRHDGQALDFLHLEADGTYAARDRSRSFPGLRSWEVLGWVQRADAIDQAAWSAEVEDWARRELGGRGA